jgi:hypothetical protein
MRFGLKRSLWVSAGLAGVAAMVVAISLGVARKPGEGEGKEVTTPEFLGGAELEGVDLASGGSARGNPASEKSPVAGASIGADGGAEPELPHSFVNDRILERLSLDASERGRLDALRSGFDQESRDMRAAQEALVREWKAAQTEGNAARAAELRGQILESAKPLTALRRRYLAEWRAGLSRAEDEKLVRALLEFRDGWRKRG